MSTLRYISEGKCFEFAGSVLEALVLEILDAKVMEEFTGSTTSDGKVVVFRSVFVTSPSPMRGFYVYWSGEAEQRYKLRYDPSLEEGHISFVASKMSYKRDRNCMHLPFALFSAWLYSPRIGVAPSQRKYLLAYCASNKVHRREEFFARFSDMTRHLGESHALGRCCGGRSDLRGGKRIASGTWAWNDRDLVEAYSEYRFVMCFENCSEPGYVTEKIVNAFASGAVPVYWGADDIYSYFRKGTFINVQDFDSFDDAIRYIANLTDAEIDSMTESSFLADNDSVIHLLNTEKPHIRSEYVMECKRILSLAPDCP